MHQELLDLVRRKGHVSFAEVRQLFPNEQGDVSIAMPGYENIILWWGLSERLAEAVAELLRDKKIHLHPASRLTYAADGSMTAMPLASELRQYKKPHWFPVTLHHTPFVET